MPDAATSLLVERERQALRWAARIRIAVILFSAVLVMHVAGRLSESLALSAVFLATAVVHGTILLRLDTARSTRAMGLVATCADIAMLTMMPVIWHVIYTTDVEPLVHLSRHNLTSAALAVVAINGLTLRPLFPAMATIAAVALHVILALLGIFDPRLGESEHALSQALGVGMSALDLVFVNPLIVLFAGLFVTLTAHAARSTVRDAVAREHAETQLRAQQLQVVLEAKIAAVGDLVAGMEHEINNPLGALRSATDTAGRALARLRAEDASDRERGLKALEGAQALAAEASGRLTEVMRSIRGFVQLDRAEVQRVDLVALLNDVVDRHRPQLRADTQLTIEAPSTCYADVDPRRLTEALSTVIRNATEAFDAPGRLDVVLTLDGDEVAIVVSDTGRGMDEATRTGLFEINFTHDARTRARFGLPLCRTILQRHGGSVEVKSAPGQGTTVTMRLPCRRAGGA